MKNENEVCTLCMYEMQDLIKSSTTKPPWFENPEQCFEDATKKIW